MNNLLLILAMMVLGNGNGNISLFDNKNKSNKSFETASPTMTRSAEAVQEDKISDNPNSGSKRSGPKIRKIKKIKRKSKPREDRPTSSKPIENRETNSIPLDNIQSEGTQKSKVRGLNFDISDLNKGIKLLDLSEEDLDRGMEIITRTKKYMNRDERNILIKLESILDLVKGIKKLNQINILCDQEESDFFRSMEDEDKKNMMIKEILEVFPEDKKQSVEKALDMKKKIDLLAELFLPDIADGSGFSLSSFADLGNLGSISNLKMLGSLLRGFDSSEDNDVEEDTEDEYITIEEDEDKKTYKKIEYETIEDDDYDEYLEVNKAVTNNKKYNKSKTKKNPNRRRKTSSNK